MQSALNRILNGYREEMVQTLQELVRIPSVAGPAAPGCPCGEPVDRAYEYMLQLGRERGFECVDYDRLAAELNIGSGPESVGVVTHLDVVPAGEGWHYPPFGGEIAAGRLYGRGAVDDKGPAVAAFYACLAIRESGLPLKRKIRQILGVSEESGMFPCIRHYKKHAAVPACGIVPDAWFPAVFAEKDFYTFSFIGRLREGDAGAGVRLVFFDGGEAFNIVAPAAEAVLTAPAVEAEKILLLLRQPADRLDDVEIRSEGGRIRLRATGLAAHASTPESGRNAILMLFNLLARVPFSDPDLCRMLQGLSRTLGQDTDGNGLGLAFRDHTGALTCNVGTVDWQAGQLTVRINIRSPITLAPEAVAGRLQAAASDLGMAFQMGNYNPHFYVDPADPLIELLTAVYREQTGDLVSRPLAHGGGSYARILPGFIPFGPSLQQEELVFHKQNEFISTDRLLLLAKLYAEALYRLANR